MDSKTTSKLEARQARFFNAAASDSARVQELAAIGAIENQFEKLEKERAIRRKEFEKETSAVDLGTAENYVFQGTCPDFCPEFERHEREIHLDLSIFEMIPGTENPTKPGDYPKIDHRRAVKKYHRPAAGNEQPLPEDVRPPIVLLKTLDYLFQEVLLDTRYPFSEVHKFIRDRTRSIRQDFTLQNVRDESCVHAHEQIARFHIVSGHILCELDKSMFDAFQNTEQLRKVLQSLFEFYEDKHKERMAVPSVQGSSNSIYYESEPEFMAYYIITHLRDAEIFRKALSFHPIVFHSGPVQNALEFVMCERENNYARFFRLIRDLETPYLSACLLQQHFQHIRRKALYSMQKIYTFGGTQNGQSIPLKEMVRILGFEDELESKDFFEHFGLTIKLIEQEECVIFDKDFSITEPSEQLKVKRADKLIESKNTESLCNIITKSSNQLPLKALPVQNQIAPVRDSNRTKSLVLSQIPAMVELKYNDLCNLVIPKLLHPLVNETLQKVKSELEEARRVREHQAKVLKKQQEMLRLKKEKESAMLSEILSTSTQLLTDSVLEEVLGGAVRQIAQYSYRKHQKNLLKQTIKEFASANASSIIQELAVSIAKSVGLDLASEHFRKAFLKKSSLFRWRVMANAKREMKRAKEIREEYIRDNLNNISMRQTLHLERNNINSVDPLSRKLDQGHYNKLLVNSLIKLGEMKKSLWKPMKIPSLVRSVIKSSSVSPLPLLVDEPDEFYCRILIFDPPPSTGNSTFEPILKWIRGKFRTVKDDRPEQRIRDCNELPRINLLIEQTSGEGNLTASLTRKGIESIKYPNILINRLNLIIFIVSDCVTGETSPSFWIQERNRFHRIYSTCSSAYSNSLPVVHVIVFGRLKSGNSASNGEEAKVVEEVKRTRLFREEDEIRKLLGVEALSLSVKVHVLNLDHHRESSAGGSIKLMANLNCLSQWTVQLENLIKEQVVSSLNLAPAKNQVSRPWSRPSISMGVGQLSYFQFVILSLNELLPLFWNDFVCLNLLILLQEEEKEETVVSPSTQGDASFKSLLNDCWQHCINLIKETLNASWKLLQVVPANSATCEKYLKEIGATSSQFPFSVESLSTGTFPPLIIEEAALPIEQSSILYRNLVAFHQYVSQGCNRIRVIRSMGWEMNPQNGKKIRRSIVTEKQQTSYYHHHNSFSANNIPTFSSQSDRMEIEPEPNNNSSAATLVKLEELDRVLKEEREASKQFEQFLLSQMS